MRREHTARTVGRIAHMEDFRRCADKGTSASKFCATLCTNNNCELQSTHTHTHTHMPSSPTERNPWKEKSLRLQAGEQSQKTRTARLSHAHAMTRKTDERAAIQRTHKLCLRANRDKMQASPPLGRRERA